MKDITLKINKTNYNNWGYDITVCSNGYYLTTIYEIHAIKKNKDINAIVFYNANGYEIFSIFLDRVRSITFIDNNIIKIKNM